MKNIIRRDWDEYDLGADAHLDKHDLDNASEIQSSLMHKWLDLLAQAQDEVTRTKNELANAEAVLQLKARKPDGPLVEYGKVTETVIKSWVITQPKYKKALEAKTKAESNLVYLQNAKTVLEHKKAMIQVESNLWTCGYFARPTVSAQVQNQNGDSLKEHSAEKLRATLGKRKHAKRRVIE